MDKVILEYAQPYLDQLEKYLEQKNKATEVLGILQEKTGVKKVYLAAGGIAFAILWFVFGYGAQLICNLVGVSYPAYASIKAIESPETADDTKWLMYWVVFASFNVWEFFIDILLSWFPLYWLLKCLFLIWCFAPIASNGSNFIYSHIVRPLFLKHQAEIDNTLKNVTQLAGKVAEQAVETSMKHTVENSLKQD